MAASEEPSVPQGSQAASAFEKAEAKTSNEDAKTETTSAEHACVEIASAEHLETMETIDVEDGIAESPMDSSKKELQEGMETNEKPDLSENGEKGDVSNLPLASESGKKISVTKSKGKKNADGDDGKDGPEGKNMEEKVLTATDGDDKVEQNGGFIFMCSSKTKKDCFDYKIFGLPESRKEVVAKVYKGMKLFLYDIDLKLLNGIYEAAGAGGYNIEPEAFKSAYPSQVRFTVVQDLPPLAEEDFREAIIENYTRPNRFDCLLSGDQVQKLCKLFKKKGRQSKMKRKAGPIKQKEKFVSAKRSRENGHGIRGQRGRDWASGYARVPQHYGREAYPHPYPHPSYPYSLPAVPFSPPLPVYPSSIDFNRRQVHRGYVHDPYGYYQEPAQPRGYDPYGYYRDPAQPVGRSAARYHNPYPTPYPF